MPALASCPAREKPPEHKRNPPLERVDSDGQDQRTDRAGRALSGDDKPGTLCHLPVAAGQA